MDAELAQLFKELDAEAPDQDPMTKDEYEMMRRWEGNDFHEDCTHLTSKQTTDLLNAWFKRDRQRI